MKTIIKDGFVWNGDGYEPKDYTASILITDEAGEPLAGQELSYRVDGGERENGSTDENGLLQITLSDGAHGVRLADTQQEIYIDNYSGFGITVDEFREQPVLTFLADGSCDPVDGSSAEESSSKAASETSAEAPGSEAGESVSSSESTEAAAEADTQNGFPIVPVAIAAVIAAGAAVLWKKRRGQD